MPYEPHITLARYASLEPLDAAYEEAREGFGAEFTDVIREVTLLCVDRNGRISPLKTIALHTA